MFSQKQIQALKEPLHDYNIFSGVTASGKSHICNIIWYNEICTAPDNSTFIESGNTEDSLYENVTRPLFKIDTGINWLKYTGIIGKKRIIVKKTGTQVICVGANTEKAQDRIQGINARGWYADEVVKQPQSFIDMADSRCRHEEKGTLKTFPIMWTCNPDAPQHSIKINYIDNDKIDVKNWGFGFKDNPLLWDDQKQEWKGDYVKKIKQRYSHSDVFYKRMILGKWVLAEGVIYDKYSSTEHVKSAEWFESRKDRIKSYYLAIDWGYENPMAIILFAEDNDNTLYGIDEIYVNHKLVKDIVPVIQDKGWLNLKIEYAMADKSRPESIAEFQQLTKIDTFSATQGEKIDWIQEVQKRYLKRGNGEYGIYYVGEKVPNLLREKDNYRWKENAKKDEPIKEDDHAQDAEQYFIFSRRHPVEKGDKIISSAPKRKFA